MTEKNQSKPLTQAERKAAERDRKKELGFVRRDVWAHPDDWPAIRDLEKKLYKKREKAHKSK